MKKIILMVGVALGMFACSGGSTPKANETSTTTTAVTSSQTAETTNATQEHAFSVTQNGNITEVVLGSTDQMTFTGNEIKVKSGTKVKLTLKHIGTMAKEVMGHNFVLLAKGTDIAAFNEKAMEAADNNYIPKMTKEVIANTPLIGGGESVTIEFDAPAVGSYDFICSFPGHYAIMKGIFIVE